MIFARRSAVVFLRLIFADRLRLVRRRQRRLSAGVRVLIGLLGRRDAHAAGGMNPRASFGRVGSALT